MFTNLCLELIFVTFYSLFPKKILLSVFMIYIGSENKYSS